MHQLKITIYRILKIQSFRYLLVGSANTLASYAIYAFLIFNEFSFQFANLITLVIGILVSFKTQSQFVFRMKDNWRLLRFIASWALIYVIITAIIGKFINLGINAYWAGVLALPFSVILSFILQKYFVFRVKATTKN